MDSEEIKEQINGDPDFARLCFSCLGVVCLDTEYSCICCRCGKVFCVNCFHQGLVPILDEDDDFTCVNCITIKPRAKWAFAKKASIAFRAFPREE